LQGFQVVCKTQLLALSRSRPRPDCGAPSVATEAFVEVRKASCARMALAGIGALKTQPISECVFGVYLAWGAVALRWPGAR